MFSTEGLTFSYNTNTRFQFADLSVPPADALLVTGRSGTGKTTLLHLLGGLLRPEAGKIVVDNTDMARLTGPALDRFRGNHIGIVFQRSHFVESLSVMDNILLAGVLAGKPPDKTAARRLIDALEIGDQAAKKPAALSQGQQQRANIARALINRPTLLLADEPTSSLDDENTALVADLLTDLSQQYNTALIIVTHDQRLKQKFARRYEMGI
jgi:lipoprotein-releasing system ATP-binding protein